MKAVSKARYPGLGALYPGQPVFGVTIGPGGGSSSGGGGIPVDASGNVSAGFDSSGGFSFSAGGSVNAGGDSSGGGGGGSGVPAVFPTFQNQLKTPVLPAAQYKTISPKEAPIFNLLQQDNVGGAFQAPQSTTTSNYNMWYWVAGGVVALGVGYFAYTKLVK